jgi:hypothetical protein
VYAERAKVLHALPATSSRKAKNEPRGSGVGPLPASWHWKAHSIQRGSHLQARFGDCGGKERHNRRVDM